MGGEFTYPKMGSQNGFDHHSQVSIKADLLVGEPSPKKETVKGHYWGTWNAL